MNMKRTLYILLFSLLSFAASAQTIAKAEFSKALGDSAYSQGRYDDAVRIYETAIENEGSSVELHYNLGNAYFRNNMLGKAILNYERALRIDPTDQDAKANLEYAQAMTKDEVAEQYEIFFVSWFRSIVSLMSLSSWAITAVAAFMLLLVALLFFFFSNKPFLRKLSLTVAIISLFVVIFANVSAISLYSMMNGSSEAVIMREEAYLKSTPDNSGTDLIKVHEGRKVRIIDDSMREWKEVELEEGTVGWLPAVAMERI